MDHMVSVPVRTISLAGGKHDPVHGYLPHHFRLLSFTQDRRAVKMSRFLNGGAPTNCAFCNTKFEGHAWRHQDRYFCGEWCAEGWETAQTPETRARKVS